MTLNDTLVPLVSNLLLLDAEGKRVAVKYYNDTWCVRALTCAALTAQDAPDLTTPLPCLARRRPNVAAQQAFEKTLFTKTSRVNARGERAWGANAGLQAHPRLLDAHPPPPPRLSLALCSLALPARS